VITAQSLPKGDICIAKYVRALCVALFLMLWPALAQAQTVNQYTNTTSGAIVDSTNCATTVTRTFTVSTSFLVSDVNLGVFLTHTYRSDLRISLTSPLGTTVNVMTNTGGEGDNLNDLFDDEAAGPISGHNATVTDPTTAPPPYSHSFQPSQALSAFDGQNASGTWTMVICDSANADVGTFTRADLYLTQPPTNYVDLSVNNTLGGGSANTGDTISYTVTVTNSASATLAATGVVVRDLLPAGLTFVSASGFGSYNSTTGDWTVGSIPIGTTRTLTINATITAASGTAINNIAQVIAQGEVDLDSTPNNNVTSEDDYRAVSFTVGSRIAGTPPTLLCPAGSLLFDWANYSWTAGSLNNNLALSGLGTFNFAVTSSTALINSTPAINGNLTGGLGGAEVNLFYNMDNALQSDTATTTITLPTAVPGAQFRIFDVDFGANSYADKITVTGSYNGSPVTPTLTNGISNTVSGNVAIGDAGAGDTTANGTVFVTFSGPVDTIVIAYGNHTTAPANPGNQWMGVHDITFCRPQANLVATKISSIISDGVSGSNPKSLPGAIVRYCITITNSGTGTATTVNANDTLPTDVTYVPGSLMSGTSCGTASTIEDDDNSDGGETDPVTMSASATAPVTITGSRATLPPGASMALVFHATIN
jgi:uncharacterized repeat protein (TIGR01451 family)